MKLNSRIYVFLCLYFNKCYFQVHGKGYSSPVCISEQTFFCSVYVITLQISIQLFLALVTTTKY